MTTNGLQNGAATASGSAAGFADWYARWRYRLVPGHLVGEVLSKTWIDSAIPVLTLGLALVVFSALIPNMLSLASIGDISHTSGEYLLAGLGMTIVVLAGGIDLSVGSVFALSNLMMLWLGGVGGLPLWLAGAVSVACGAAVGAINGLLVGYLRLRAFLTTLVTMIVVRGLVDALLLSHAQTIASVEIQSASWDYIAFETIAGMSVSFIVAIVLAVTTHLLLTRLRPGWHLLAVGGSRRAAYNAGIDVRRTVCATYVLSGMFAALAGVFYAARLSSLGGDTGVGLEIAIITAVVLGGTTLGGGRGSVFKTVIGVVIVVVITNSLVRLGLRSGAVPLALGLLLLVAVALDVRWLKNRHKLVQQTYVAPVHFVLPALQSCAPGGASPYAINTALSAAEPIGLGEIDAPEDVILDANDDLYCGSRNGDVIRFFAPDYERHEVFAHIGGSVLGLASDRAGNLLVCVGGMGLYKVTPDRRVEKLSDETSRTPWSVIDDSRLRLADDLDIAPDGSVFFSEATIRYDMHDWIVDALEGRGNGRIIHYDPATGGSRTVIRNLQFPNGICMTMDGESFLFAETWGCRISRYWFAGPRKGRIECVIPDLPGYPDNINLASDGNFWCGMIGMRTPAFDLAQRMPGFRRRMVLRTARDEWLYPNMNTGGVIKFALDGTVLHSLWDQAGERHPQVTSMREHKGWLYLGGIFNNRIGRIRLDDADPEWTARRAYWGKPA